VSVGSIRLEHMFERERFSGLPGPGLATELAEADPFALDEDDLASYLQAAKRLEAWADSLLARGICAFAEGHTVPDPDPDINEGDTVARSRRAFPGLERAVRFGGEGTPVVAEFAADALAPLLRVAPMTAGHLLGDALDLWHRLPWVRTGLRDGTVSWQAARAIAAGTRDLTVAQLEKARVDRRLYTSATRLTPGKLRARIAAVVAQADPEAVNKAARRRTKGLHVGFAPQPHAQTTSIFGELDPAGAQRLDAQVSAVAGLLRRLDAGTAWEALRARALTLLADPAALYRLQQRLNDLDDRPDADLDDDLSDADLSDDTDGGGEPGGQDDTNGGGEPGTAAAVAGGAAPRLSTTVVHLHADTGTWEAGQGLVEMEGYGWVPLWSLADMLDETRVRVVHADDDAARGGGGHGDAPGSDPPGSDPAGGHGDPGYRPRQATRDAVAGRDRTCRFPGCNRHARSCQCDHTIPWPHGPTCACNLGCLCTRHHRLKTHGRWRLRQPWPGVFLWRSPTGRYYLVDHSGTTGLGTTGTTDLGTTGTTDLDTPPAGEAAGDHVA
jgi:hypothetical protein